MRHFLKYYVGLFFLGCLFLAAGAALAQEPGVGSADSTQEMIASLLALLNEVKGVGWGWAGAVAGLVGLIRLWRSPIAQSLLAGVVMRLGPHFRWLLWDELPSWVQFLIPFIGALAGGVGAVLAGGMTWPAAIVAAVGVGFASIGTHHATKAVGSVLAPAFTDVHPAITRPVSLVFPGVRTADPAKPGEPGTGEGGGAI